MIHYYNNSINISNILLDIFSFVTYQNITNIYSASYISNYNYQQSVILISHDQTFNNSEPLVTIIDNYMLSFIYYSSLPVHS